MKTEKANILDTDHSNILQRKFRPFVKRSKKDSDG